LATLSIQEYYFSPSQITTPALVQAGQLPSILSRYTIVTPAQLGGGVHREGVVDEKTPIIPIGVHSIRYTQQKGGIGVTTTNNNGSTLTKKYDGISFHHGFGASSLSWLPALPSIVERLGFSHSHNTGRHSPTPAVGVAHDAPGFGFTDRPNGDVDDGLRQYSSENSANIGLALLVESLSEQQRQQDSAAALMSSSSSNDDVIEEEDAMSSSSSNDDVIEEEDTAKSIAIFGHSMGARAALLMAHHCATNPTLKLRPNLIVLVAPALEGVTLPSVKRVGYHVKISRRQSPTWSLVGKIWTTWRKVFVDPPLRYGLRRLVCGTKDFWRNGLVLAWGDSNRLSDSDVLRFQWPSVGRGWEDGILNFSRSRILSSHHPGTLDDVCLLKEVTNLKDTRVVIVYGSNDGIVRIDNNVAERVCKDFPNIKFIRMEGCGHDPFEEDVQGFVTALEKSIECE
jgi:pimeloyl-ACP methyl ester carboxylesterase